VNRARECFEREGLGEAGDAFEENVPVGEQTEQEAIDEPFLADDDPADLSVNGLDPARRFRHPLLELANLTRHHGADGAGYAVGLLEGLYA
jgi:hypothetical protein